MQVSPQELLQLTFYQQKRTVTSAAFCLAFALCEDDFEEGCWCGHPAKQDPPVIAGTVLNSGESSAVDAGDNPVQQDPDQTASSAPTDQTNDGFTPVASNRYSPLENCESSCHRGEIKNGTLTRIMIRLKWRSIK